MPEIFTRENHSNCTIGTDDVPADPEGHNRGLLESDLGEPRLSFLISTLGWDPRLAFFFILGDIGEFLIKDIVLRGAVLWSLGESLYAIDSRPQATHNGECAPTPALLFKKLFPVVNQSDRRVKYETQIRSTRRSRAETLAAGIDRRSVAKLS
jgi:hypothetical protein